MIYFDNSATTSYKPVSVVSAVSNTLKFISANPGRSGHKMSVMAGTLVYKTRAHMADYLGVADSCRIVFTHNCTAALNIALLGTVKNGGHVITTAYEHNSVLRPLFELERMKLISLTVLEPNENLTVTAEQILQRINSKTYLIITNHISNVTGAVTPIKSIGKMAKDKGLLYLVDGAQSVGYGRLSLPDNYIDLLSVAPHKGLHASQGVGVLAIGENVAIKPTFFGGTGTDSQSLFQPKELPESLECGTLPTPAIASLNAALFWSEKNMNFMREKIRELSAHLLDSLKKIDGVTVYTPKDTFNGIIAFNLKNLSSVEIAETLSEKYGICVRGGLHCAPLIHKHLGTLDTGIIRASLGIDNSYKEVNYLITAIKEILNDSIK